MRLLALVVVALAACGTPTDIVDDAGPEPEPGESDELGACFPGCTDLGDGDVFYAGWQARVDGPSTCCDCFREARALFSSAGGSVCDGFSVPFRVDEDCGDCSTVSPEN